MSERARFLAARTAGVAQLVEHLICNQRVRGSNPFASSRVEALCGRERVFAGDERESAAEIPSEAEGTPKRFGDFEVQRGKGLQGGRRTAFPSAHHKGIFQDEL